MKIKIRDGSSEDEDLPGHGFAPFNTRAIAAVIDLVVAIGLMITVIFIMPGFASKLGWLVMAAYLITRDSLPFLGGQSVGKKAMKIKAVTLDDKSLVGNWEVAAIRNGVLLIPFFGLIELFILLTREDKPERGRRLGDEWAKTKVIMAPDLPAEEKVE
ncbi:MAG: RDD family protein [Luteolibacter sp.]